MSSQSQFGAFSQVDQQRKAGTPELAPPGNMPTLTNIYQCSTEFLNQLRFWFEQNPPTIPISNIPGFSQFTAQVADRVDASQTTSSTTYTDLGTVGPSLTNLPDGQYLFMFGFVYLYTSGSGVTGYMGLKINSTEAVDADSLQGTSGGQYALTGTLKKRLTGGANTVTTRYRVSGTTPVINFGYRWLVGFRMANA